jgi:hypothetical protein
MRESQLLPNRELLIELRIATSLSAVSEAPMSEELGVEALCRRRFRYSDLKEAASGDYGICIWMSRS